jgi:hypothetical protein
MTMEENGHGEVPNGAAFFPEIPEELGVNPLWLAVVHATVFILGSDENIIEDDAAVEASEGIAMYLKRLKGDQLQRVREDMDALIGFARQQKWSKPLIQAMKNFLADLGLEEEE